MLTEYRTIIETAAAKALATHGPAGLNVVPVSMVKVNDETIWLFNFFMGKTLQNISDSNDTSVSLTCWSDLSGIQIKATCEYIPSGPLFVEAKEWVHEQNPTRVLKGVLVLRPHVVYDVTADLVRAGIQIFPKDAV